MTAALLLQEVQVAAETVAVLFAAVTDALGTSQHSAGLGTQESQRD